MHRGGGGQGRAPSRVGFGGERGSSAEGQGSTAPRAHPHAGSEDEPFTDEAIGRYATKDESRTSLMIRNVPYGVSKEEFTAEVSNGFEGLVDYCHLVWDADNRKKCVCIENPKLSYPPSL